MNQWEWCLHKASTTKHKKSTRWRIWILTKDIHTRGDIYPPEQQTTLETRQGSTNPREPTNKRGRNTRATTGTQQSPIPVRSRQLQTNNSEDKSPTFPNPPPKTGENIHQTSESACSGPPPKKIKGFFQDVPHRVTFQHLLPRNRSLIPASRPTESPNDQGGSEAKTPASVYSYTQPYALRSPRCGTNSPDPSYP